MFKISDCGSIANDIGDIGATFQRLAGRFSEALANLRNLEATMGRVNSAILATTATAAAVEDQVSGMGAALADAFGMGAAPEVASASPPPAREEVLDAFAAAGWGGLNGTPTAEAPAPTLAPVATAPVAEAEAEAVAPVAEAVAEAEAEAAVAEASARAEAPKPVADRFPGLACWADVRALDAETVNALLAEVGVAPTGNAGKDRGALWSAVKALRGN